MMMPRAVAGAFLWAGMAAAGTAQAQGAKPCLPAPEAEALVLSLAPQLIQATATACAQHLPPAAHLRRPPAQLTGKYAAEDARAWPLAKQALKKLTGPETHDMLDSELAKPMIGSMIAPMLAKEIKPADCPAIDRVMTLIDPLPARNTAALIVTILDLSNRKDKPSAIAICPATRSPR